MGGSNLARIEKSAQKQAKSGSGSAGWYEKWYVSIHFFLERRVGCLSLRFLAYRLRATDTYWCTMWLNSIWTECKGVIYLNDSLLKFAGKFGQLVSLGLVCVSSHLAASKTTKSHF